MAISSRSTRPGCTARWSWLSGTGTMPWTPSNTHSCRRCSSSAPCGGHATSISGLPHRVQPGDQDPAVGKARDRTREAFASSQPTATAHADAGDEVEGQRVCDESLRNYARPWPG